MYANASMDGEAGQQLRSNMFSLTGTGFFGAVGRSINLGNKTSSIPSPYIRKTFRKNKK